MRVTGLENVLKKTFTSILKIYVTFFKNNFDEVMTLYLPFIEHKDIFKYALQLVNALQKQMAENLFFFSLGFSTIIGINIFTSSKYKNPLRVLKTFLNFIFYKCKQH